MIKPFVFLPFLLVIVASSARVTTAAGASSSSSSSPSSPKNAAVRISTASSCRRQWRNWHNRHPEQPLAVSSTFGVAFVVATRRPSSRLSNHHHQASQTIQRTRQKQRTATLRNNHPSPSSSSLLFAKEKNKYASESKRVSQEELLRDLDSRVQHYEGRIDSKSKIINDDDDDDNDDDVDDDDDNLDEGTQQPQQHHPHRCGLITILGKPNMGKSTLLNALLSDDLAIATSRPQTTRHAILGVLTTNYAQLCLTDTPGIIPGPAYRLQEGMMDAVRGAVRDADVFLVVTDVYGGRVHVDGKEEEGEEGEDEYLGVGEEVMTKLRNSHRPVIVVVNKVDLAAREEEEEEGGGETTKGDGGQRKRKSGNTNGNNNDAYANTPSLAVQTISKWRATLPDAFAILPACAADGPNDPGVSALRAILTANDPNVDVASSIRRLGRPVPGMFGPTATAAPVIVTNREAREILPLGPPLYHPDFFTDRTDRFCASESIRETLFTKLGKELPYCCEVRVETFDESRRYLEEEDDDDGSDGEGNGNSSGSTNNNNTKKRKRKQKPLIKIGATILVERDSQVGIVVGKGGQKIKEVGMESREKLRALFEVEVMLELRVKVDKNWRNDVEKLKRYGYAG